MNDHLIKGRGVFEITDHTTASDWERFIANIEEILTDWKLNKRLDVSNDYCELPPGFISRGLWHEKHDQLRFGNVTFDLRYQYLDDSSLKAKLEQDKEAKLRASKQDTPEEEEEDRDIITSEGQTGEDGREPLFTIPKEDEKEHGEHELPEDMPECLWDLHSTSNDFASKAHCLVRWYNLRKFLIISPRGDTIITEDKCKLVQSSASIALANIDCHIPMFVQIHNPKNHYYQGISEHLNIRTMYEMVFFKQNLKQYSYLSELVGMFREKIGGNLSDPITATIRLNYCLSSFDLFVSPHEQFTGIEHEDDDDDDGAKKELLRMTSAKKDRKRKSGPLAQDMRSGATFEQVNEALEDCVPHPYRILRYLHVAALWPPMSDKVVTDSQVHSDLDPAEAPIWTLRCVSSDNCNIKIVHETQVVYDLLKTAVDFSYDRLDASQAFADCTREELNAQCLRISYELATQPEVVVSRSNSDSIRKVLALLFHRATELFGDPDALDEIAGQLKKQQPVSLNEIYRNFKRQKPSVKEFIIRAQISRPFNPIISPALPQRMFCTICPEEFRLCGAFSELCN